MATSTNYSYGKLIGDFWWCELQYQVRFNSQLPMYESFFKYYQWSEFFSLLMVWNLTLQPPLVWRLEFFMEWSEIFWVRDREGQLCQFGGKWEFRIFNQTFRILFGQLRKSRRTKIAELFEWIYMEAAFNDA